MVLIVTSIIFMVVSALLADKNGMSGVLWGVVGLLFGVFGFGLLLIVIAFKGSKK